MPQEANSEREELLNVPCRQTFLPGILRRCEPGKHTDGIALLLHGQMAHKNQTYHRKLAQAIDEKLHVDSFRFDFTHAKYNQPDWEWHMCNLQRDVDELQSVIAFLETEYRYRVTLLIGHSKGALSSFMYLSQTPSPPPYFVNLSGRHDMQRAKSIMGPRYYPAFAQHGFYEWKLRIQGQNVAVKITPDQFEEFVNHDTSFVEHSFPRSTHVLTIHGDADEVVPVDDGHTYHRILSKRLNNGSSTLKIMNGADHNYLKRFDEVVEHIVSWMQTFDKVGSPLPKSPKGRL